MIRPATRPCAERRDRSRPRRNPSDMKTPAGFRVPTGAVERGGGYGVATDQLLIAAPFVSPAALSPAK